MHSFLTRSTKNRQSHQNWMKNINPFHHKLWLWRSFSQAGRRSLHQSVIILRFRWNSDQVLANDRRSVSSSTAICKSRSWRSSESQLEQISFHKAILQESKLFVFRLIQYLINFTKSNIRWSVNSRSDIMCITKALSHRSWYPWAWRKFVERFISRWRYDWRRSFSESGSISKIYARVWEIRNVVR